MKEVYSDEFNWWQKALKHALGMWRINSDSIDFKWGYFSPRFGLELMFNRGFYFDQRCAVTICLVWGTIHLKLPFKTKLEEGCEWPKYGFSIFGNSIMAYWGMRCEVVDLPFVSYVFEWHRFWSKEGWIPGGWENRENAHIEEHTYTYILKSGEVQNRIANCVIEERQWHRKWLPFIKMRKRSIDVNFNDEVGERSGSWKGGTVGCGYEMLKGETIEQCLRRMEKEREFR